MQCKSTAKPPIRIVAKSLQANGPVLLGRTSRPALGAGELGELTSYLPWLSLSLAVAFSRKRRRRFAFLNRAEDVLRNSGLLGRRHLQLRPLECGFGAEVRGINVPSDLTAAALRRALWQHGLLIFRGQDLLQEDLLRLAQVFAEAPQLGVYHVKDRDPTPRGQDFWHSDNSYAAVPGGPTLLYALKVPESDQGPLGDTLFLDAAVDLPPELRRLCENRRAGHNLAQNGGQPLPEFVSGDWQEVPDALQPVLRKHPITGQEVVFVNEAYVRKIEGLTQEQSVELIADLQQLLLQHCYRHRWQEEDVLVWDNHRLQHKATTLELPKGCERLMWRVQTRGPGFGENTRGALSH
ncbi:unnamed protein product [Effrenium voratum]|nr:unnamed protein product [Effrenium voratum]CAJ1454604.1 unnamed protein product [Effrenium voratum]